MTCPAPTDRTAPTQLALRQLDRDGFATIGRLSLDDTAAVLEASRRIASQHRTPDGRLHLLSAIHLDPALTSLITWPRLLDAAVQALTPNIYVNHSHLDVHPPESPSGSLRWHRDGGVQGREMRLMPADQPRLAVKAAVFLTDVDHADDGAFELIPGSHRDAHVRPPGARDPEAVAVCCPAGTVVLFDTRVWHRRRDNLRTRTRTAIFFNYTYRWIARRDVPPDPAAADRARFSPLTRQLLGEGDWDPFYLDVADLPAGRWHPDLQQAPALIG